MDELELIEEHDEWASAVVAALDEVRGTGGKVVVHAESCQTWDEYGGGLECVCTPLELDPEEIVSRDQVEAMLGRGQARLLQ